MQYKFEAFDNPEMKQYFSSLPALVQESITQSGIKFDSVEQLKNFAENINK